MNWDLWQEGADGPDYSQSIYELVKERQPSIGLEIGVRFGKSAMPALLASPKMHLFGVDPNPEFDIVSFMNSHGLGDRFTFFKAPSPDYLPELPIKQFDYIYIDGLHDYWGVWRDFVSCWPMLKEGGVMVMDDCDDTLGYDTEVLQMLQDWTEVVTGKPFKTNPLKGSPHKAEVLVK